MRPLDESLLAPVASRPALSPGSRDQAEPSPGAFGEAIADAGRRRAQGQGDSQSHGLQQIITAKDGRPSVQSTVDGFGENDPAPLTNIASPDGGLAPRRANTTRDVAGKPLPQDPLADTPRQSSEGEDVAVPAHRAAGRGRDAVRTSADASDEASGVAATAGGKTGEPAGETVSDLLSMLAGAPPVAAAGPHPEGRTRPASAARDGVDSPTRTADGRSLETADGEHMTNGEVTGESEPDRLFRFARADGRGQAVSMSVSPDGERATVENGRSSVGSRAEAVTVLEARRYLGLAVNENASSVTSAIAGDSGWAEALQSGSAMPKPEAWSQAAKTLNTLKIQMHPVDLGMVTATLRLKDDELQVDLKVETGEAFRQLRDDQSEMVKTLRAQGFTVDQVNIVFNGGGDNTSNGGGQSQAQAQFGQEGRERAGEEGSQGRQPRDGGRAAAERWAGNDGTDDVPDAAGRSRAGHVYM